MHPAIRWSKQDPLLESYVYELKETTAVNTTTVMKRKCMILELQVETKEHLDTSSVRVCEENVPMKKRRRLAVTAPSVMASSSESYIVPVGMTWSNNSCAYDSVFTILFAILFMEY